MIEFEFVNPTISARLCLVLMHSLWQFTLLATGLWIIERLWRRLTVQRSYALHVSALCAGLVALLVTWCLIELPGSLPDAPVASSSTRPELPAAALERDISEHALTTNSKLTNRGHVSEVNTTNELAASFDEAGVVQQASTETAAGSPGHKVDVVAAESVTSFTWVAVTPWLVAAYAVGVVLMLVRLLLAVTRTSRLVRTAMVIADGALVNSLKSLAEQWAMKSIPILAATERIIVPQVVGLVRPTILLPASALTGLTHDQLVLILTHEMAHLRRHDMWVNLLQRIAETLLFYNPPLWYVTRRISTLREYCCDDLTCDAPSPTAEQQLVQYAAALLKVVEVCSNNHPAKPELASLAASGHAPSELRRRIARLFGEPLREPVGISRSGLLAICGAVLLLIGPTLWPASAADDEKANAAVAELAESAQSSERTPKVLATSATDDVKVETKNRVLRGTITNDDGEPVPDVKVTLFSGYLFHYRRQETTTDVQGNYCFDPNTSIDRESGLFRISFAHPVYVPRDDIPFGVSAEVFDVVMIRGGKLKGVVKGSDTGEPVAGLDLRIQEGFFQGKRDGRYLFDATTNDDGEFAFGPVRPQKYVIEIRDHDYPRELWRAKIGQVELKTGETESVQLTDAPLKQLLDPFVITGTAHGTDGKSMVYGGVGVKLVNSDGKLRSRGGGIDGRPVFGLAFGPIDRSEPAENSPYGIGTHDVEIFGSNSRYGYRLKSRTPSEPLRITDDPNMPELKDGIRYIRPGKPLEFKLVYAPDPDMKRMFSLKVVGPDGKPVPHAQVQLRTNPAVTKEQIHRGEYVKDGRYGNEAKANKDGELYFTLSKHPTRFNLKIQTPGFAPYWAGWSATRNGEPIPDQFTAKLDAGWIAGGIVVDSDGKPVQGVEVHPSVQYKKLPGDSNALHVGDRMKTDAEGKWKFECVPASQSDVHVEVSNPSFQPHYQRLARDTFGLEGDAQPSAKIQLERGLSVTGTVTDEAGRPIEGALIRTKFLNDLREAKTNSDGVYKLEGCDEKMARIVVSAKGKATDMQTVRVVPDMEPVNFVMKPGGHVKIRVVDENGKGIPKARIYYQSWRGSQAHWDFGWDFDHKPDYADENGVWEWNEAPLDEFTADICRPGGMQLVNQQLFSRDEEFVFTPPKMLVISGKVTDAKTQKPIDKFRVVPGTRDNPDFQPGIRWDSSDAFDAQKGAYTFEQNRTSPAHLIRIEAEGYKVASSREIKSNEGKVEVNFALEPAEKITVQLQDSDGAPAVAAEVVIGVASNQISIKNGDIGESQTYAHRLKSDADGRFTIASRDEPFQIVVMHESGFAHLESTETPVPEILTLTPWARAVGTYRIGNKPAANIRLNLSGNGLWANWPGPNIFSQNSAKTDANGHFEFPRVFPGRSRIGRQIDFMMNDGATVVASAVRPSAEFVAGETTTINLGGTGRPVTGRLVPPADFKE